jgi:hypothetical protein
VQDEVRSAVPRSVTGKKMMKSVGEDERVWAVMKTLPKNLIAAPPCKVPNGKGFVGTCPLAPPCAQSHEMEMVISNGVVMFLSSLGCVSRVSN